MTHYKEHLLELNKIEKGKTMQANRGGKTKERQCLQTELFTGTKKAICAKTGCQGHQYKHTEIMQTNATLKKDMPSR